jgi:hypothetical protein
MAKERRPNGDAQMITMQAIATHTLATALARAVAATLAGQGRPAASWSHSKTATPRACSTRLWIAATSRNGC